MILWNRRLTTYNCRYMTDQGSATEIVGMNGRLPLGGDRFYLIQFWYLNEELRSFSWRTFNIPLTVNIF